MLCLIIQHTEISAGLQISGVSQRYLVSADKNQLIIAAIFHYGQSYETMPPPVTEHLLPDNV